MYLRHRVQRGPRARFGFHRHGLGIRVGVQLLHGKHASISRLFSPRGTVLKHNIASGAPDHIFALFCQVKRRPVPAPSAAATAFRRVRHVILIVRVIVVPMMRVQTAFLESLQDRRKDVIFQLGIHRSRARSAKAGMRTGVARGRFWEKCV